MISPRTSPACKRKAAGRGNFLERTQGIAKAQAFLQALPDRLGSSFGTVLGIAGRVGTAILGVATVFVLTGCFMVALPRLRERATVLLRPDVRERAEPVIELALVRIGGYVAGNAITSGICALVVTIGLIVLRVPFAIPLGIWAGFADLIPMVGSYAGAIPAIVIAFFVSPMTGLLTALFFVAYQQFENYALVPRVMRKRRSPFDGGRDRQHLDRCHARRVRGCVARVARRGDDQGDRHRDLAQGSRQGGRRPRAQEPARDPATGGRRLGRFVEALTTPLRGDSGLRSWLSRWPFPRARRAVARAVNSVRHSFSAGRILVTIGGPSQLRPSQETRCTLVPDTSSSLMTIP
jgi:hypothetical protein